MAEVPRGFDMRRGMDPSALYQGILPAPNAGSTGLTNRPVNTIPIPGNLDAFGMGLENLGPVVPSQVQQQPQPTYFDEPGAEYGYNATTGQYEIKVPGQAYSVGMFPPNVDFGVPSPNRPSFPAPIVTAAGTPLGGYPSSIAQALIQQGGTADIGPGMLANPRVDPWAGMRGPGENIRMAAQQPMQQPSPMTAVASELATRRPPSAAERATRQIPQTSFKDQALGNPGSYQIGGQRLPTRTMAGGERYGYGDRSSYSENAGRGGALV